VPVSPPAFAAPTSPSAVSASSLQAQLRELPVTTYEGFSAHLLPPASQQQVGAGSAPTSLPLNLLPSTITGELGQGQPALLLADQAQDPDVVSGPGKGGGARGPASRVVKTGSGKLVPRYRVL
jgi:hypothetical protein